MHDEPRTSEARALLRARVEDDPQLRGLLVTPDNRAALVILDFWESASHEAIFTGTTALAAPYHDRPIDFYFAGEPVVAMNEREQSREVAWHIPLTFLVIAAMLILSFRSLQGMLLPMLTAILSVVWALGFMGFSGIVIDSWNVAVPILLIAVAAAHSAQMLKRYGEEVVRLRDNREAVVVSTATMGPVMIAAGMTAALGFASLALFGVRSIANFGLSCAYGIGSAVVLEMTFIPALRALLLRTASLADLVKSLHKIFNPEDRHPYRVPDDQPLVAQLMYLGESPAFERFTDRALSKALLLAYLRDDDSARVGPLVRRAQAWVAAHPPPEGVQVLVAGGVGPTILAVNEHTTHGKLLNTLVVLCVIYLVSSLMLRSALGGLYVVSPIVATVAILFGVLGWSGIKLDMGSASVIAMAAGIGADYAIYFLYRLREERARLASDEAAFDAALHTSGRAVIFVAASIGAGFSVMAFSKYLGLRLFGTLMPIAMGVSCIAALSLMPGLVLRTRPAFVFGRAAKEAAGRGTPPRAAAGR